MEPGRAQVINKMVKLTQALISQDMSHFEQLAQSEISTWDKGDGYAVRGILLAMISLIRGDMIRYLHEDGSPFTHAESSDEVKAVRSEALDEFLKHRSKLEEIVERAKRGETLHAGEIALLALNSEALFMLIDDGTVTK